MDVPLTDSPHLVEVPSVDLSNAVLLTRCAYQRLPDSPWVSYSSWEQMFSENADRLDYLLTPDDYRALGRLEVIHPGNTADRPKTIRYYNPTLDTVHPVGRPLRLAARVDSFQFDRDTSNWLVQGLTVRWPEKTTTIRGARLQHHNRRVPLRTSRAVQRSDSKRLGLHHPTMRDPRHDPNVRQERLAQGFDGDPDRQCRRRRPRHQDPR